MKIKLFLDFDNVIVNSDRIIHELYVKYYGHLDKNLTYFFQRSTAWDYSNEFPMIFENNDIEVGREIIESYYKSDEFFERLSMTEEDKNYLIKLNKFFDVYICTIGSNKNISKKLEWCDKNIPFLKNIIALHLDPFEHTKELVDMSNGIFVDDKELNLVSSNASRKIHYHRGSSKTLKPLLETLESELNIHL